MPAYDVTLYFDGSSSFNCGPDHLQWSSARGSYGWVAYGLAGQELASDGKLCPVQPCSSNMAELCGAIAALTWAMERGSRVVRLRGDSQFVIRWLEGRNKTSQLPHIGRLQRQLAELIACEPVDAGVIDGKVRKRLRLDNVSTDGRLAVLPEHVPRSKNRRADLLAGRVPR